MASPAVSIPDQSSWVALQYLKYHTKARRSRRAQCKPHCLREHPYTLSCAPRILPALPAPSVLPLTLVNIYTGNSVRWLPLKKAFPVHVLFTGAWSSSAKAPTSRPPVSSFRYRSLQAEPCPSPTVPWRILEPGCSCSRVLQPPTALNLVLTDEVQDPEMPMSLHKQGSHHPWKHRPTLVPTAQIHLCARFALETGVPR